MPFGRINRESLGGEEAIRGAFQSAFSFKSSNSLFSRMTCVALARLRAWMWFKNDQSEFYGCRPMTILAGGIRLMYPIQNSGGEREGAIMNCHVAACGDSSSVVLPDDRAWTIDEVRLRLLEMQQAEFGTRIAGLEGIVFEIRDQFVRFNSQLSALQSARQDGNIGVVSHPAIPS
jgi:hypothetical protein